MASKLCLDAWLGLVDPHDFRYGPHKSRRVCVKCGLLEREVSNDDFDYPDWSWEPFGVVDKPHLLAKAWEKEKEEATKERTKKEMESMYGKRNWEDVK